MSFGIANNIKGKVRVCTPELFHEAIDSQVVAEVCAQIKDALEAVRRGEMSPEDFETLKGNLKKALIIFTFHATFKNERSYAGVDKILRTTPGKSTSFDKNL